MEHIVLTFSQLTIGGPSLQNAASILQEIKNREKNQCEEKQKSS